MRLGNKQLQKLRTLGPSLCQIVGDDVCRSLAKRGLLASDSEDGEAFYHITPDGMRALADAIDDGKLPRMKVPTKDHPSE